MMRSALMFVAAASAMALAAPANAATFFQENFDGYGPSLQWNGAGTWTTGNSVDLVASGTFNLTCAGGSGNCVDLTGTPGTGVISTLVNLAAGTYKLSFAYTGNQLDAFGGPWPVAGFTAEIADLVAPITGLANNTATFATYSGLFTTAGGPIALTFTQNGGNEYRGSILDSILISSVPEPTTWALMIAGFGIVGFAMRRRQRHTVRYS